jgi:hypothetical protein
MGHRPSQDLDFATSDGTPLPEIAKYVREAFQSAGYGARRLFHLSTSRISVGVMTRTSISKQSWTTGRA